MTYFPGDVVGDCARANDEYACPGPAVGADGPGLERAAHGDVALDGDAEGEVGAARLRDHTHRVHERHDVRVDVPVVEREVVPAVEVDRGEAVHQHAARG